MLQTDHSNWRSVAEAIRRCGKDASLINFDGIYKLPRKSVLVVPGVGHMQYFQKQMSRALSLENFTLFIEFMEIRLMGICLGFQLLSKMTYEGGALKCMSVFDFEVEPLFSTLKPSVGWKTILVNGRNGSIGKSLVDLLNRSPFYFTHSYGVLDMSFLPTQSTSLTYRLDDGREVLSALMTDTVIGFQFHPEKSGTPGLRVLAESLTHLENQNDT